MKKNTGPVLVMAGGTGGHVFPALAVARELRARGIPVVWLGTRTGLEAKIIPAEGIPIRWLAVSGLRGKKWSKLVKAPFMLLWSGLQALWIMLRIRPRVVLGMGGFVTGPGGLAAKLTFRPLCIHEQNAIAGFTNRMLAKIANRVCEAFPKSIVSSKGTLLTGNPVRQDIASLPEPAQRFSQHSGPMRLLVLGGSLGAQAINEIVPLALAMIPLDRRPLVRHQAGERILEQAQMFYRQAGVEVELLPFIKDMADAYGWADLVLCRSGALTVCELAAAGVGSILVPFPHAVDDHQTANARYLTNAQAAFMIPQRDLRAEQLAELLLKYAADRPALLKMAQAARSLAITDAAKQVADLCLQLTNK